MSKLRLIFIALIALLLPMTTLGASAGNYAVSYEDTPGEDHEDVQPQDYDWDGIYEDGSYDWEYELVATAYVIIEGPGSGRAYAWCEAGIEYHTWGRVDETLEAEMDEAAEIDDYDAPEPLTDYDTSDLYENEWVEVWVWAEAKTECDPAPAGNGTTFWAQAAGSADWSMSLN